MCSAAARLIKARLVVFLQAVFLSLSVGAAEPVGFNRDVRPILSDNCFRCHGPELKSRKAKLRLDVREVAVEKGAIVTGQNGARPCCV